MEEHQIQDHPKDHRLQLEALVVEVVALEQERGHQVLGLVVPEELVGQEALVLELG